MSQLKLATSDTIQVSNLTLLKMKCLKFAKEIKKVNNPITSEQKHYPEGIILQLCIFELQKSIMSLSNIWETVSMSLNDTFSSNIFDYNLRYARVLVQVFKNFLLKDTLKAFDDFKNKQQKCVM